MPIERTQGIILQARDFQDYDQLLTLFTQDHGLLKLIFKGAKSKKRRQGSLTSPLTLAEILFVEGKTELHKCHELSTLDLFLSLRQSLDHIQAGCDMMQAILQSQLVEKPAPLLYQLLYRYLKLIDQTEEPQTLVSSFRLKILRHDGLLDLNESAFHSQETEAFEKLSLTQSTQDLHNLKLDTEFHKKVECFFEERIR